MPKQTNKQNHPNDQNKVVVREVWKHNMRYYFRMLARSIYYLHVHCNIAHLDISLENTVIDANTNVTRVIDFGLARHFPNITNKNNDGTNWKYSGFTGKIPYHSPEIRTIFNVVREQLISQTNNNDTNNSTNNTNANRNDINNELSEIVIDSNLWYDARGADVWALGVILFILLVGGQPWEVADSDQEPFKMIMNGQMREVLACWKSEKFVDNDAFGMFCIFCFCLFCLFVCIFVCIFCSLLYSFCIGFFLFVSKKARKK